MKTVVQNLVVEYENEGAGPVILMLHGWKDTLHTFDGIASPLMKTHRVLRLDMPGFGGSEMPKGTWDISAYVDFVEKFIGKLHLDVDTIIGHSFGGRITIKGVGTGVLKPRHVVLVSAAGLAKRKTIRNTLLAALSKIGRIATAIPPFSFRRQELRRKLYKAIGSDYFNAGVLKDTFVKVVSEDLSEYAKKISVPTLIVWGSSDDTTPIEQADRIHSLVRGSVLKVIDGGGHFVHCQKPTETADEIKKFI